MSNKNIVKKRNIGEISFGNSARYNTTYVISQPANVDINETVLKAKYGGFLI